MTGHTFPLHVSPRLPERLHRLPELAANLWFSWHRQTRHLFELLDRDLWWKTGRNPRKFLRSVDQAVLELAAGNDTFLSAYRRALAEFDAYHEPVTGGPPRAGGLGDGDLVAYFCAEFGYHESFPIYSGGLGILAGDHCKTASDMRLPFVAVGLLYRQGYFDQQIDEHGRQIANYLYLGADDVPVSPAKDAGGHDVVVTCRFSGRNVHARVWEAHVGRTRVLLLDTDIERNGATDRQITRQLYGGDSQNRLQQEIILGIGGVRALRAVGFEPTVWHINEGHAALMTLERARELVAGGLPFGPALEAVAANSVFTTHTPVKAGHDVFSIELLQAHLDEYRQELGLSQEEFFALAGGDPERPGFNMTLLALTASRHVNGVSRLHRAVTAQNCAVHWPELPPAENPVGYVTNGVHVPTFLQTEWMELFAQHLGPGWEHRQMERELAREIEAIPDGRFWYVDQQVKSSMLAGLRERLRRQHLRNRYSEAHVHRLLKFMDPDNPDVLTVGFARRFATYKRATLLFRDLGWLSQLVCNEQRPVVFVFAGKAHPADLPAQEFMREVHRVSNLPEFFGRVLLVEGYDMGLGRLLTSGVDVWLNTPVHPLEASGTSGIKAAVNGTVNLSVLDGWWAEAYDGSNGWAIPPSPRDYDAEERDQHDARTLYEILQDQVASLYYDRDERLGYSPGWVQLCKRSMASVLPHFNMQRVVNDYANLYYGPAARFGRELSVNGFTAARGLAEWKSRVRERWDGVRIVPSGQLPPQASFNDTLELEVEVELNGLDAGDLRVECVVRRELCSDLTVPLRRYADRGSVEYGVRNVGGEPVFVEAFSVTGAENGRGRYRIAFRPPWCGALGLSVRVVPWHQQLVHPYGMGLMRWLDFG